MKKLARFLAGLVAKIKALFVGIPAELKHAISIGVVVVQNFKLLVDSPVADLITALIPGNADDKVKDVLRARLPGILMVMRLIETTANLKNEEEVVKAALDFIASLSADDRKPILHELSIRVAQVIADGNLSWSDAVYLLEYYYQEEFKRNSPEAA